MLKFKRAVFCYYISRFDKSFYHWLLSIKFSKKTDGLFSVNSEHKQISDWIIEMFSEKKDFETILHILSGDNYFEKNKSDILKIQKETGKNIIELWDTDPIFLKYPHLRTMARNQEFEENIWNKIKQRQK